MGELFALLIFLYFLPSIICFLRGGFSLTFFAINLFTAWTVVGWLAAMILAVFETPGRLRRNS